MEEKIYDRQVIKLATSKRVIDAHQIDRHFTESDLNELYDIHNLEPGEESPLPKLHEDELLSKVIDTHKIIHKLHSHESLLEEKIDEHLTKDEMKLAWEEFENEKWDDSIDSYPCLQISPPFEPEEMSIFGFTTFELLQVLTIKAEHNEGRIPSLLTQLHSEIDNGQKTVRFI